jgi:tRNA-modifying protein YgfZ
VVSRMEHRGTARSRILPVTADAPLATGSVTSGSGRSLGRILSTADRRGLALIRLDRLAEAIEAGDPIRAGASAIKVEKPGWAHFAVPGAAAA